ncbi:hypothetical protein [Roseibium sp.]
MKDWEPHDPKRDRWIEAEATILGVLMIFAAGGLLILLLRG